MKTKIFKNILRVLTTLFSVFMVYWYFISAIINIGSIAGTALFTTVGSVALFWDQITGLAEKKNRKHFVTTVMRVIAVLLAGIVLYFGIVTILMIYGASRRAEKDATVVVLGCQVNGTNPSKMLQRRIDTACQYLKQNPDAKCVVSGGKGSNEDISEAQCMYNALVGAGITADRIYMEDKSESTYENIKFSEEIIAQNGLNPNLAIVTDGFHEFRASMIAGKQGFSSGAVCADTPFYLLGNFATREILAITAEMILG